MGRITTAVKERLVRAAASVLFHTGAIKPLRLLPERFRLETLRLAGLRLPWIARRKARCVQVFTHHRVNDEIDPFLPATPTRAFARQVRYLADHYTVCDANDLKRMLVHDEIPERAVIITFDDGYRDVLLNAYPVIKELGVPATVFLPAAHIGTTRMLWHDQVARAFRATERPSVPAYGNDGARHSLETQAQRVKAFRATVAFLRTLDSKARSRWIERLHEDLEVSRGGDPPALLMTWDDVRAMQKGGISFGSHTVTHPILSRLPRREAAEEIEQSKGLIEAELGRPVRVLAYPNGTCADFSEDNKEDARAAGYDCAVTTIFGANHPGDDLFELRRGGPWEEHLPTFALKLVWYRLRA